MTVFAAENVRDRRGKPVIDPSGAKTGELEAVYVDTTSDEPAFATVKIGMIADGELAAAAGPAVFSHYGLPAGNDGVRRLARR